ncbi:MAG: DNA polymerase III subunit beta [Gammaproteobacteria bacterium]|nr:DNA polymerase III subunit beta [Gammaproteobacteria bacterium]
MKFTIQREQLLKPLLLVTGVVERRQTLPVLANLLVKASENRLEITGTDLEVELVVQCDAQVEQAGEATLPARKLADIWRSLGEGAEVSVAVEGDRAVVRSGRSKFTLATLPAADFPKVPGGEADVSLQLSQKSMGRLIDDVSFAMAQQDVRYFLNGMLLEVDGGHTRAVATDGHRLAMSTCMEANPGVDKRVQAIVPRKGVLELGRLLDGGSETLDLQLGGNHLRVQSGDYTLTTKLVDGQFPDYEKVIPSDASRHLSGDRETLKNAFQRASILSNEKYRGVRLLIEPEQLTIQANNPEQEEAEEVVAIEFNGDNLEIGFNVSYLLDVLNVLKTDGITLSVSDANSSALIEGNGNDAAVYVVMPMRL